MTAPLRRIRSHHPALEAGFFHAVEQIGLGADSISIVEHGCEHVLPFDAHRSVVVEGDFDAVIEAAPGGLIAGPIPRGIVRISLDRRNPTLTLEDCHGLRLTWRLRFLGH